VSINSNELLSWVNRLANTKPYRIVMKNGQGFYEIMFLYNEYHYNDRIFPKDMEDETKCRSKIMDMCSKFEQNIKLRAF
jgi:hypothetical protein